MSVSLIAAIGQHNCIGRDGTLPWHIPEDMKHFKKLTQGKPVLMGRKTWESIPKKYRPLPDRVNIVITRQTNYELPDGVVLFSSIPEAIAAHGDKELMIIGGAQIYNQTIEIADTLYITRVNQVVEGCHAFFPEIDTAIWHEQERDDHDDFSFITYKKTLH